MPKLDEYRSEAVRAVQAAGITGPALEAVKNASSAKALVRALKQAALSIPIGKHRNDLTTMAQFIDDTAPH